MQGRLARPGLPERPALRGRGAPAGAEVGHGGGGGGRRPRGLVERLTRAEQDELGALLAALDRGEAGEAELRLLLGKLASRVERRRLAG